jgi:hypothetical protein
LSLEGFIFFTWYTLGYDGGVFYLMSNDRRKEKMGYWYNMQREKKENMREKIYCKLCGKLIRPGSLPQLRYGVGIICKECSDKKWKRLGDNRV